MSDDRFERLRAIIQDDAGQRGLARLFALYPRDLELACQSLAATEAPRVVIVTGFYIATAGRPETDGPLGALLLAEAIVAAGGKARLVCEPWLREALILAQPAPGVEVLGVWPGAEQPCPTVGSAEPTHLIAVERPGPSWADGRYRSMLAIDITEYHHPAHRWFEVGEREFTTIGIGDGGNEIGMGKAPRQVLAADVLQGAPTACRTPADLLIVAGISNWGAYALAAGFLHLRDPSLLPLAFDAEWHRRRWQRAIDRNLLVDGRRGAPVLAVDGQPWEAYIRRFRAIRDVGVGR
jgi:hypothetical protein